jgi:hypothetical protein
MGTDVHACSPILAFAAIALLSTHKCWHGYILLGFTAVIQPLQHAAASGRSIESAPDIILFRFSWQVPKRNFNHETVPIFPDLICQEIRQAKTTAGIRTAQDTVFIQDAPNSFLMRAHKLRLLI